MKNKFLIVLLFFAFNTISAQAPQKMSFQAIIRNSDDNLLINTTIGIKVSILAGSANGNSVYEETHLVSTNQNGLISIDIGNGSVQYGNFSQINWSNNSYFIKTETDPFGGNNYTLTTTSQLLSVPYALYAENTKSQGKTTLYIRGDISDQEAANLLEKYLGPNTENIYITDTNFLTSVDLSNISNLVKLTVTNNLSLTTISANSVDTVFDEMIIKDNPNLQNISFNSLNTIFLLLLNNNSVVNNLNFPNLSRVQNYLTIENNHSLQTINLPNLTKGELNINVNSALTSIDVPNYTTGYFTVTQNSFLTNINAISFNTGLLIIASNNILPSINFPNYTTGNLSIAGNDNLTTLNGFTNYVNGNLTIQNNSNLTSIDNFVNFITGDLYVDNNSSLTTISLPNYFSGGSSSIQTNSLTISNNSSLSSIDLQSFTDGGIKMLSNNSLNTINLPSLNSGNIILDSNASLINTNFNNLTEGFVSVLSCNSITQLDFPSLTNARFNIIDNNTLDAVSFPNLQTIQYPNEPIIFTDNKLSSNSVNYILNKLLTVTPNSGKLIYLYNQNPSAPPTGQGIIDKQLLINSGNTVFTD